MNICMCGYQPGDYAHRPFCPYPLFRGTEADEQAWTAAEAAVRDAAQIITGRKLAAVREAFDHPLGVPLDPAWPGEEGYAHRGEPGAWYPPAA